MERRRVWTKLFWLVLLPLAGVLLLLALAGLLLIGMTQSCPDFPPEPVQPVSGPVPGGGMLLLAVGGSETCVESKTGEVWCWGANDGIARQPIPPSAAKGPDLQLAVHLLGVCTVDRAHVLRCRLRSTATNAIPRAPWLELPATARVVLGERHGCAVRDDASLWCFGANEVGQLGATTALGSQMPVKALERVKDVAVGATHTCALLESGRVSCWGKNDHLQVGPLRDVASAESITLPRSATALAVGTSVSYALLDDGRIFYWGQQVFDAQHPYSELALPRELQLEGRATALSATEATGCALLEGSGVTCWGQNYHCALGDYYCFVGESSLARRLAAPSAVTALAVGDEHTCALLHSGNVACAGSNAKHQLGSKLPFAPLTYYAHHSVGCDQKVWAEPPGWPDLLPVIW
jgi:alpha-tubulin suppressor-like RCC1 family protein